MTRRPACDVLLDHHAARRRVRRSPSASAPAPGSSRACSPTDGLARRVAGVGRRAGRPATWAARVERSASRVLVRGDAGYPAALRDDPSRRRCCSSAATSTCSTAGGSASSAPATPRRRAATSPSSSAATSPTPACTSCRPGRGIDGAAHRGALRGRRRAAPGRPWSAPVSTSSYPREHTRRCGTRVAERGAAAVRGAARHAARAVPVPAAQPDHRRADRGRGRGRVAASAAAR